MPKYYFNQGEKVFLLRSSNHHEEDLAYDSLGEITDLRDIDDSPYCYETYFSVEMFTLEADTDSSVDSGGLPQIDDETAGGVILNSNVVDTERYLHWEQIGLVSDSRDWRVGQLVTFDTALEEQIDDGYDEEGYGRIGYIFDIYKSNGNIQLLTPKRGKWAYMSKELADATLSPLTELEIKNNYGDNSPLEPESPERSKLIKSLREIGKRINFEAREFVRCYGCEEWINPEANINLRYNKHLCNTCCDEYEYDCYVCESTKRYCNTSFRFMLLPEPEYKEIKVCFFCQENRIFKCRGCSSIHIDKDKYNFNSDFLCFKCYDIACFNGMTNPSRALSRSQISKILLPGDKIYRLNKSKTPVAVEIECVHDEWHSELEDSGDYVDGYPKNWSDTHDGSLSEGGREFMMMPEVGDDALRSVEDFCNWALEDGWYTDNSCGIHVHTDAFYLGVSELKGIMVVARALEPFIYQMLPLERSKNRYSTPMNDKIPTKAILEVRSIGEFCNLWYKEMNNTYASTEKYNDSRYRGLNMHSRMLHGTVEYRYHHGSLNSESIVNWMMFCLTISDFGANLLKGTSNKIKDLFIQKESKDFSDYLSAMKADSLIPYVRDMIDRNNPSPQGEPPVWVVAE